MHRLTYGKLFISALIGRPHAAQKVLCTRDIVLAGTAFTGIPKFEFAIERPALDRDSQRGRLCGHIQTRHGRNPDQRCTRPPRQPFQIHGLSLAVTVFKRPLSVARASKMSA